MTLLIGHINDPPMGEMGITGTMKNYCVTLSMIGIGVIHLVGVDQRKNW